MKSSPIKKLISLLVVVLIVGSFFLFAGFSSAQNFGINDEFAQGAGLGTSSFTDIIASVINVFLGILGIIFLVIIIYAGFIWMTAGGDPAKVEKAKKMIIASIIGVVIILSSYAIASFIFDRLLGGINPPSETCTPPDHQERGPGNCAFRDCIDDGTGNGVWSVWNYDLCDIDFYNDEYLNIFKFESDGFLELRNPETEYKSVLKLPSETDLNVSVYGHRLAEDGLFDDDIKLYNYIGSAGVSSEQLLSVFDNNIVLNQFDRNERLFNRIYADTVMEGMLTGLSLKLRAGYEDDMRSSDVDVKFLPLHCFNNVLDTAEGETGIDCGGDPEELGDNYCGACAGEACDIDNSDSVCSPNENICRYDCDDNSCICVGPPIIDYISPADDVNEDTDFNDPDTWEDDESKGSSGNYITIWGRFFGKDRGLGRVEFIQSGVVVGEAVYQLAQGCEDTWTNRKIIVQVPEIPLGDYTVVVTADNGLISNEKDFEVDNIDRPSVCFAYNKTYQDANPSGLYKESGIYPEEIMIVGDNFGNATTSDINWLFRPTSISQSGTDWSGESVIGQVPQNAKEGFSSIFIKNGTILSNYYPFGVSSGEIGSPCGFDTNTCIEDDITCNDGLVCEQDTCICKVDTSTVCTPGETESCFVGDQNGIKLCLSDSTWGDCQLVEELSYLGGTASQTLFGWIFSTSFNPQVGDPCGFDTATCSLDDLTCGPELVCSDGNYTQRLSGLMGYWKLNNSFEDYSGKGHDAVVEDGVSCVGDYGFLGNGFRLGEQKRYLNLLSAKNSGFSQEGTVSVWVYPTVHDINANYIFWGEAKLQRYLIFFQENKFIVSKGIGESNKIILNDSVILNKWYHLVLSWSNDDENFYGYLNGERIDEYETLSKYYSNEGEMEDLLVGRQKVGGRLIPGFLGNIDELAFFDRKLDDDEIKALYDANTSYTNNECICQLPFVESICGNGIIENNEQCDDGNLIDGDGCSSECKLDQGFVDYLGGAATQSVYAWIFSYGKGSPLPSPYVIESCARDFTCQSELSLASPSPWSQGWTASHPGVKYPKSCLNSIISVRFNTPIKSETIAGNLILLKCDNNQDSNCQEVNHEIYNNRISSNNGDIFDDILYITPQDGSSGLTSDQWYKIIIKEGITSNVNLPMIDFQEGIQMDYYNDFNIVDPDVGEDNFYGRYCNLDYTDKSSTEQTIDDAVYCWNFQTRSGGESEGPLECPEGCVECSPDPSRMYWHGDSETYNANLDSEDNACLVLDPWDYDWTWSADNGVDYVNIENKDIDQDLFVDPEQIGTATGETLELANQYEKLNVYLPDNKKDYCRVYNDFTNPIIIEDESCHNGTTQSPTPWILSKNACLNALISARFSREMTNDSLKYLSECDNDNNSRDCSSDTLIDNIIIEKCTGTFKESNISCFNGNVVDLPSPEGGWDNVSSDIGGNITIFKYSKFSYYQDLVNDASSVGEYIEKLGNKFDDRRNTSNEVFCLNTDDDGINCKADNSVAIVRDRNTDYDPYDLIYDFSGYDDGDKYSLVMETSNGFAIDIDNLTEKTHNIRLFIIEGGNDRFIKEIRPSIVNPPDRVVNRIYLGELSGSNIKIGIDWTNDNNNFPRTEDDSNLRIYSLKLIKNRYEDFIGKDYLAEGFVIDDPTDDLDPNTWYRVIVLGGNSGVRSEDENGNADGILNTKNSINNEVREGWDYNGDSQNDYYWVFRTGSQICDVESIRVEPETRQMQAIEYGSETEEYNAIPQAANCNILNRCAVAWDWKSVLAPDQTTNTGNGVATITNNTNRSLCSNGSYASNVDPEQTATSIGDGTTFIKAKEPGGIYGYGELNVGYHDFWVTTTTPKNLGRVPSDLRVILGEFNSAFNHVSMSNNFQLFQCIDASCSISTNTQIGDGGNLGYLGNGFNYTHTSNLTPGSTYLAVIKGGNAGVKSSFDKLLSKLNYDSNDDGKKDAYAWRFTATSDSAVEIESNPCPNGIWNIKVDKYLDDISSAINGNPVVRDYITICRSNNTVAKEDSIWYKIINRIKLAIARFIGIDRAIAGAGDCGDGYELTGTDLVFNSTNFENILEYQGNNKHIFTFIKETNWDKDYRYKVVVKVPLGQDEDGNDVYYEKTKVQDIRSTACEIDDIKVDIWPRGGEKYDDNFFCYGDDCGRFTGSLYDNDISAIWNRDAFNSEYKYDFPLISQLSTGSIADDNTVGNQHLYMAWGQSVEDYLIKAVLTKTLIQTPAVDISVVDSSYVSNTSFGDFQVSLDGVLSDNIGGMATLGLTATDENANTALKDVYIKVFICKNPWPSPENFPFADETNNCTIGEAVSSCLNYNFETYYCRDYGNDGPEDDLPALSSSPSIIRSSDNIKKEFLWPREDDGQEAIGLRIMENTNHLSPYRWYQEEFKPSRQGTTQSLFVDNYPAIKEGRTTYIHAGDLNNGGGNIWSQIYLLSYAEGADDKSINIYNQMIDYMAFNFATTTPSTNKGGLMDLGYCTKTDSVSTVYGCWTDDDCRLADWGYCMSDKSKLTRDVIRLSDLSDVERLLEQYKGTKRCSNDHGIVCYSSSDCYGNGVCGNFYPYLPAGTYQAGKSLSVWPSWQATLGNDLGTALPVDPLNYIDSTSIGIVFVTDVSGSMGLSGVNLVKLQRVQTAINNSLDQIFSSRNKDQTKIGLISFSAPGGNNSSLDLTNNLDELKIEISTYDKDRLNGATYTKEAIIDARAMLDSDYTEKYIILLSDGLPTSGHEPNTVIDDAKGDNIDFYTIAYTNDPILIEDMCGWSSQNGENCTGNGPYAYSSTNADYMYSFIANNLFNSLSHKCYDPYNETTCWDENTKTVGCDSDNDLRVYTYYSPRSQSSLIGNVYKLFAQKEYDNSIWQSNPTFFSDFDKSLVCDVVPSACKICTANQDCVIGPDGKWACEAVSLTNTVWAEDDPDNDGVCNGPVENTPSCSLGPDACPWDINRWSSPFDCGCGGDWDTSTNSEPDYDNDGIVDCIDSDSDGDGVDDRFQ